MQFSPLGHSGLSVSRICLGTMTWGLQNTQAEANSQINHALDAGINFMDTAEMYPVPPSGKTYADTERFIGNWIADNPERRKDWILATKIAGPGFPYVRNNAPITGENVGIALEGSLARLKTDYIDLYQLHWPNRMTPHFGKHALNFTRPTALNVEAERDNMRDILLGLKKALDAGKIRHWGLSDDTTWGIHTYINLAKEIGMPGPVSIQNEFNLLHTKDWPFLIESCVCEDVAYLPWSPLSGGMLSGKYLNGQLPAGSRQTYEQRNGLFRKNETSEAAIQAYVDVANRHEITPSQLALAWCDQVDGVTSTIIGATSMPQLKENIAAFDMTLSAECLAEVSMLLRQYPAPF